VDDAVKAVAGMPPGRRHPLPDRPSGEAWVEGDLPELFPRLCAKFTSKTCDRAAIWPARAAQTPLRRRAWALAFGRARRWCRKWDRRGLRDRLAVQETVGNLIMLAPPPDRSDQRQQHGPVLTLALQQSRHYLGVRRQRRGDSRNTQDFRCCQPCLAIDGEITRITLLPGSIPSAKISPLPCRQQLSQRATI
jgi:hypothetical protein